MMKQVGMGYQTGDSASREINSIPTLGIEPILNLTVMDRLMDSLSGSRKIFFHINI